MMKIQCLLCYNLFTTNWVIILLLFMLYWTIECRNISKHLCNRGDYASITRQLLNINWEVLFEGLNTEEMWSLFHSKLLFLIHKYFPTQKFERNSRHKWLNSSLLMHLIKNIKHGTLTKLLTVMMTMFHTPRRETLLLLLSKEQSQFLNSN